LNDWDNGTIGNYWDDYVGVDVNQDGIGDTPYLIDGTAGSVDNYPIFKINPIINILEPEESSIYATSPPDYNIEIFEFDLDSMWYTMDDGTNNITITSWSGTLDETAWNALPDGFATITFYANDTMGNIGSSQVAIIKDTTTPLVAIITPYIGDFFGSSSPEYEIDVMEDNLDSVWYTVDAGVTNFTVVSYSGSINNVAWTAFPEGPVIILFYANDTVGNVGVAQVTIYKDSITPIITINHPEAGDEFTTSVPLYDIEISEVNLDKIWYTINNGQNIIITLYAGILNESIWNTLPNGPVTIKFFANDTAGNIGSDVVIIYKSTPSFNIPPGIPGSDVFLIFFITFLAIISLSWKSLKKVKLNQL
jgi:hypothetical protein